MKLEKKLEENIYYYTEVIPDPEKLISLIKETDGDPDILSVIPAWTNWLSNSGDGVAFGGKKDFNVNNLDSLSGEAKEKATYIVSAIQNAVKDVAYAFVKDRGLDVEEPSISPFAGVMKYIAGLEMGAHYDAQAGDESLWWSMVIYLNDDYEGGEISFTIASPEGILSQPGPDPDFEIAKANGNYTFAVKPKAGSMIVFPPSPPYHHTAHLVKSGFKYMVPQHWIH